MSVLHYVEHWLELSSGFVHAHVSRSRHRAVVVSHNATENRAAFPHRPVIRLDRLHTHVPPHRWPELRTTVLRGVVTATRARLVHVHFGYVAGDVVGLIEKTGLPFVVSLHGSDATSLPKKQPGHYERLTDLVDAVIVPSQFLARAAAEIGFPADRVHVIPAGIDTGFFTPSPVSIAPVVTFVGRLVEKKGVDTLLRAWPGVVAAVPGARLDVVGAGPLDRLLPSGDPSVRHLAPRQQGRAEQVRNAIRDARVVAAPSRTSSTGDAESLLLVNLEAQASGRPVVTTRHGGIPEFVADGESALLIDEDDADALAESLIAVLTDDELAARLGAAGPASAARFDVAGSVRRVDALYDELIARRERK
ncbi:MAG TPA: glycosyltransferase [Mycobacteriales bacterium]|nr:glycosyltransferase [Mycobacteriales bacterium]